MAAAAVENNAGVVLPCCDIESVACSFWTLYRHPLEIVFLDLSTLHRGIVVLLLKLDQPLQHLQGRVLDLALAVCTLDLDLAVCATTPPRRGGALGLSDAYLVLRWQRLPPKSSLGRPPRTPCRFGPRTAPRCNCPSLAGSSSSPEQKVAAHK